MLKKLFFSCLILTGCINATHALTIDSEEEFYIDDDEIASNTVGDAFHIHIGNNIWLISDFDPRNANNLFTNKCNVNQSNNLSKVAYERKWKCPYCHGYWPIGKACQDPNCPSKYR